MAKSNATNLFTKQFKEQVFLLWMGGMSLQKICKRFKGTSKEFSLCRLNKIRKKDNWGDRKAKLEAKMENETNLCVLDTNREKVMVVKRMIMATIFVIRRELDRFEEDPEKFLEESQKNNAPPMWLTGGLDQLREIFDFHDEVVNGKQGIVEKDERGDVNIVNINTPLKQGELTESKHTKALEALVAIDAEIIEEGK